MEIRPEITQMAKAFADLDAEEQAQFFDALHIEVSTWEQGMVSFLTQMSFAYTSSEATPGGRQVMQAIAVE